ncbi:MAG: hypothetical protein EXS13_03835 [Planctomycetes bacterium]|nr:hypothetical protein [Planctomycetota bacterium]
MARPKLALAITGALLLAMTGWRWQTLDRDGPRIGPDTSGGIAGDGAPAADRPLVPAAAAATADVAADRTASPPSRETPHVRVAPGRALLHGFVADRAGVLVAEATLTLDESGALPDPTARANRQRIADGEYALPALPAAIVGFCIEAKGFQPLALALDLPAGGVLRHDFVLDRAALLPIRLVDPDGIPLKIDAAAEPLATFLGGLTVIATERPLPARLPPVPWSSFDQFGTGTRHRRMDGPGRGSNAIVVPEDAFMVLEARTLPCEVSRVFMHHVVGAQRASAPDRALDFRLDPAKLGDWLGTIELRVVDAATDQPLAGADVQLPDLQSWSPGSASTADGRFTLDAL